ncbi:lysophospholipid acyltransferase family protein [Streptomyces kasugaensis]|uniref:lysophospholipid acyltransferase family protein n=1 Tax=Streptomyces kasugaensis TaxID=1946 RepID=UPI001A94581D|nr:lysophospholipid acyltransferase family protein [Streptomyces kasugaensis]
MNGAWDIWSACTPRCARHAVPPVPAAEAARRGAAFARAVRRALAVRGTPADGGRPPDPALLRAHARALLTALGIRLETADGGLRVPAGGAPGAVRGDVPRRAAPGAESPGGPGTLVVANHISWLDILALLAVEPVTLLAKREVGGWPVVGGLARSAGTHFIDRTSPRQLPYTVGELAELLGAGHSVAVFPQATTWCTAAQGTFRRATFQAAIDAGAPVRPVTLTYTQHTRPSTVAAFCGTDTFVASLRRVLTARGLTVRVAAHPGLPAGPDRRTLAALARTAVMGEAPRPVWDVPAVPCLPVDGARVPEPAPAPASQIPGTYL